MFRRSLSSDLIRGWMPVRRQEHAPTELAAHNQGTRMADHRIDAAPDTVHWGYFDAALKPLITVASGDTVTISTVSGMAGQMPAAPLNVPPALAAIHKSVQQKLPGHICTGPVGVRGAKKG